MALIKWLTDNMGRLFITRENIAVNLHYLGDELNNKIGDVVEHWTPTDLTVELEEDETTAEEYDITLSWTPNPNLTAEDIQHVAVRLKDGSDEWGDWVDYPSAFTTTTGTYEDIGHDVGTLVIEGIDLTEVNGLMFGVYADVGNEDTHIGSVVRIERISEAVISDVETELVDDEEFNVTLTWSTPNDAREGDLIEIRANEEEGTSTAAGPYDVIATTAYPETSISFDYDFDGLDAVTFYANYTRNGLNGDMGAGEEVENPSATT